MRFLKHALIVFFIIETMMFLMSQFSPAAFVAELPVFNVESTDGSYPRLVGVLFLMMGIAKLYGALYIAEKGAFMVAVWSWVVELGFFASEVARGQFLLGDSITGLVGPCVMLLWSLLYYRRNFPSVTTA